MEYGTCTALQVVAISNAMVNYLISPLNYCAQQIFLGKNSMNWSNKVGCDFIIS
jgi:hypothetical protein